MHVFLNTCYSCTSLCEDSESHPSWEWIWFNTSPMLSELWITGAHKRVIEVALVKRQLPFMIKQLIRWVKIWIKPINDIDMWPSTWRQWEDYTIFDQQIMLKKEKACKVITLFEFYILEKEQNKTNTKSGTRKMAPYASMNAWLWVPSTWDFYL